MKVKKKLKNYTNIKWKQMPAEKLNIPDNSFDYYNNLDRNYWVGR